MAISSSRSWTKTPGTDNGYPEGQEQPPDETVQRRPQVCFVCGKDKTQDFIDSINNKTYPDYDEETKKDWGYTKEKGWPHYSSDYAIYKDKYILSFVQLSNLIFWLWMLITFFIKIYNYFRKKFD